VTIARQYMRKTDHENDPLLIHRNIQFAPTRSV
jgi:hypothetical protein